MLHQGNSPGKNPSSGQRRVHKGQQRHSQGVLLPLVPCGHNSSDCTVWQPGYQRTVAHLNWLRSQSAPLVPKNSKERGSSKAPEHGSAPVAGSPSTGRREHPAQGRSPPRHSTWERLLGCPQVQRPPSTSWGKVWSNLLLQVWISPPSGTWCQV